MNLGVPSIVAAFPPKNTDCRIVHPYLSWQGRISRYAFFRNYSRGAEHPANGDWIQGCDRQRERSPRPTAGSEIPLGGEIAARAGQAHGMRHADVQTVAFERCPVDPGQFYEPV
jgi:hypothetical protein